MLAVIVLIILASIMMKRGLLRVVKTHDMPSVRTGRSHWTLWVLFGNTTAPGSWPLFSSTNIPSSRRHYSSWRRSLLSAEGGQFRCERRTNRHNSLIHSHYHSRGVRLLEPNGIYHCHLGHKGNSQKKPTLNMQMWGSRINQHMPSAGDQASTKCFLRKAEPMLLFPIQDANYFGKPDFIIRNRLCVSARAVTQGQWPVGCTHQLVLVLNNA